MNKAFSENAWNNVWKKLLLLVVGAAVLLVLAACQTNQSFKVLDEDEHDEKDGFISEDILQVHAVGEPADATKDAGKAREEARKAAVIRARMQVLDYILFELKSNEQELYKELAMKVGTFSIMAYDTEYGEELLEGASQVDGVFEMMNLRGYVHKENYDPEDQEFFVAYRIVRAGLRARALKGFQD